MLKVSSEESLMSEDEKPSGALVPITDPKEAEAALEEAYEEIEKELAEKRARGELPPDYGDWYADEPGTLSSRHMELCRLLAEGWTNKEVCIELGYSPSRVSILKQRPEIQNQILKFQDRKWTASLDTRFKDIQGDAMDIVEKALSPQSSLKEKDKVDTAKWAIEHVKGKAAQHHNVESGTLGRLLDKLEVEEKKRDVKEVGVKDQDELIEASYTEVDPIESWFTKEIDEES